MNFGHGALGFGAWPSAKSRPLPEYSIVFRVSAPMAFDALSITALAFWAAAGTARSVATIRAVMAFLNILASSFSEVRRTCRPASPDLRASTIESRCRNRCARAPPP